MWHLKILKKQLLTTCAAVGTAALMVGFMSPQAHAQSGTTVTSGMGGGASSTARLQAQVSQLQSRLAAIEACGNKSMLFGPSYGGLTDADGCTEGMLTSGNRLYAPNRLMVGSTSVPAYPLDVAGVGRVERLIVDSGSGGANLIDLPNGYLDIRPTHASHGIIMRDHTGGGITWGGIRINPSPTRMEFAPGSTSMYGNGLVLNGTDVGIGIGTPIEKLDVDGSIYARGQVSLQDVGGIRYNLGDTASGEPTGAVLRPVTNPAAGNALFVVQSSGYAERLRVEHQGVVSSVQNFQGPGFFYSSDRRLKKNMEPLDGEDVLEKIMQIDGTFYEWKDKDSPEGRHVGFVAQDVEKVFPELVRNNVRRKDGEDYKSVSYGQMTAPLLEAVKALKKRNDALEKEVAELKEMVKNLR